MQQYLQNKKGLVQNVFDRVYSKYDLMNDFMSLGIHRIWKKNFINMMNPSSNKKLIDVACGTGDIGKLYLDYTTTNSQVTCVDPNPGMINEGKKKLTKYKNIKWIIAPAEKLPLSDNSFDYYSISFGIRNVSSSEIPFLKKNKNRIKIFWAKDKEKWNLSQFKKMIKNKKLYLTFDVDGLDSSLMPATGTPEPGGLFWDETIKIIKTAAKFSKIVGADINELSPIKGFDCYNFLVAKLAYKIISYSFEYRKFK